MLISSNHSGIVFIQLNEIETDSLLCLQVRHITGFRAAKRSSDGTNFTIVRTQYQTYHVKESYGKIVAKLGLNHPHNQVQITPVRNH